MPQSHETVVALLVGSLRKASINQRLARAIQHLAPTHFRFDPVAIGELPLVQPGF